jgi:FkbM family methyltransferase
VILRFEYSRHAKSSNLNGVWKKLLNPIWLVRNAGASWRYRASLGDFMRRMLLTYSQRLPRWARRREWTIGFRYPRPIGNIRLLLRDNAGSDLFIHSEVFEHEYYRVPLARAPATILDLGANIGLTTVYLSRLFPGAKLACVEPVPESLRLLARNLELNTVRADVFAAAVDTRDGAMVMALQARDYEHKIAATPVRSSRPTLEVAGMSVPTILRALAWDRIGLLKVDIEGHEAALFARECEWLYRVDAMCIEWHHHFAETDLNRLANQFDFAAPQRLPGVWFMGRLATNGSDG